MKNEIRLYVNGEKVFADFDFIAFKKIINSHEVFGNGILEQAISAATKNKLQGGKKLARYKIEGWPRNPRSGLLLNFYNK